MSAVKRILVPFVAFAMSMFLINPYTWKAGAPENLQ